MGAGQAASITLSQVKIYREVNYKKKIEEISNKTAATMELEGTRSTRANAKKEMPGMSQSRLRRLSVFTNENLDPSQSRLAILPAMTAKREG